MPTLLLLGTAFAGLTILLVFGSGLGLWVTGASVAALVWLAAFTKPPRRAARDVPTPWGLVVQGPLSPGSRLIAVALLMAPAAGLALAMGLQVHPLAGALLGAAVLAVALGVYRLERWSTGGILPGWMEPLLDERLPPIRAGTPQEWLRDQVPLGGISSAQMDAAAVRAVWWEPEPASAVADLRWRVNPDPSERALKVATRAALRAATRAVPGRGGVRATGGLRRVPGPDVVTVRLVVRCHTSADGWVRGVEEAFAREFERRLARRHALAREA